MSIATIVSGDTAPMLVGLSRDGATFAPAVSDAVRAVYVHGARALTDQVLQISTTPGANWPAGLIAVAMPEAQTAQLRRHAGKQIQLLVIVEQPTGRLTFTATLQVAAGQRP
jgi:hypothetical protein